MWPRIWKSVLALTLACGNLLPVGWCCAAQTPAEYRSCAVESSPACCRHRHEPSTETPHCPVSPRACCCIVDRLPAAKTIPPVPDVWTALADWAPEFHPHTIGLPNRAKTSEAVGRPKHLLQCVWLC
ncbi:MAG: hypothetical protein ACKV0T_09970 [Planctomycetales bacterium]